MSGARKKLRKMLKDLNMENERTSDFILDATKKLIDLGYEEEEQSFFLIISFERNIVVAYKYCIQLVQTSGVSSSAAASQMLEKLIEIEKKMLASISTLLQLSQLP